MPSIKDSSLSPFENRGMKGDLTSLFKEAKVLPKNKDPGEKIFLNRALPLKSQIPERLQVDFRFLRKPFLLDDLPLPVPVFLDQLYVLLGQMAESSLGL